jgi:hypothetical protein
VPWTPGRRLSGRARLGRGLFVLAVAVLLALAAGRLLGGPGVGDLAGHLWRILGVRVETPTPAEGPPAAAGGAPGLTGAAATGGGGSASGDAGTATTVAPDAVFLWAVTFEACGCGTQAATEVPEGSVGLGRETLAIELRDWEITSFAPERVELARTDREAMCPAHTKRTLRLEEGKLVLYAGSVDDPGVELILIITTGIVTDDLNAGEVAILSTGLTFDSHEEALSLIEGLGD